MAKKQRLEKLAKEFYETYATVADWNLGPLSEWEELSPTAKKCWEAIVAKASVLSSEGKLNREVYEEWARK